MFMKYNSPITVQGDGGIRRVAYIKDRRNLERPSLHRKIYSCRRDFSAKGAGIACRDSVFAFVTGFNSPGGIRFHRQTKCRSRGDINYVATEV